MSRKHGESYPHTAEYRTWFCIKQRCCDPACKDYQKYGAKGITICAEWRGDYVAFLNYLLATIGRKPSELHSIDRYPNQLGNYEPGNIRWATSTEQNRNRRDNVILTVNGVARCQADWAAIKGLTQGAIYRRKKLGWTDEEAVMNLPRQRRSNGSNRLS